MTSKRKALSILAVAVAGVTVAALSAGDAGAATTLRQLADAKGKDIGFALTSSYLNESQYKTIADDESNLVVPENGVLQPDLLAEVAGRADRPPRRAGPPDRRLDPR